ncbi:hypothetical protein ACQKD0_07020, partial [Vreelandella aquamarina]|uniref:hypothetical protein n=1 Tax=Vreelandella aquamarina TaxID=77097 RepID=UPI003CFC6053
MNTTLPDCGMMGAMGWIMPVIGIALLQLVLGIACLVKYLLSSSLSDLRLMDELRRGFFTPLCWCWCWCCCVALNLPLSFCKAVLTPCLLAGW